MSQASTENVSEQRSARGSYRQMGAIVALLALIASVLTLAFTWTAVTSEPRNLPVAIAGPQEQVDLVVEAIEGADDDSFDVQIASDSDEAESMVRERSAFGAVLLGDEPEVLTASANGLVTMQMMQQIAVQLQQSAQERVTAEFAAAQEEGGVPAGAEAPVVEVQVTDIVSFSDDDERGAGMAAIAFPLIIAGVAGSGIIAFGVRGAGRQILALFAFSVLGGTAVTAIAGAWLGILQGEFWSDTLAVGLSLFAIAGFGIGLKALLPGAAGLGVAALTNILFANPISGAQQPAQFLPGDWGVIGQWFVPGSSSTLLRNLSYFPDAGNLFNWAVIIGWSLLGLALIGLGAARDRSLAESGLHVGRDEQNDRDLGR